MRETEKMEGLQPSKISSGSICRYGKYMDIDTYLKISQK